MRKWFGILLILISMPIFGTDLMSDDEIARHFDLFYPTIPAEVRVQLAKESKNPDELRKLSQAYLRLTLSADEKIPCQNHSSVITEEQLESLWLKILSDPHFRGGYPSALCYERALLIEKILSDSGIGFETLQLDGLISAAFQFKGQFRPLFFRHHVAPVVTVRARDGSDQKFVLDPDFTEKPLSLKDYLADTLYGENRRIKLFEWPAQLLRSTTQPDKCVFSPAGLELARRRIEAHISRQVEFGGEPYATRALAIKAVRSEFIQ